MGTKKSVLITGANKGIGFEIARQLGSKGFQLFMGARNKERGQEAENRLRKEGMDAHFVSLDVSQPTSIQAAFEAVQAQTPVLDVLVNNAAVLMDEGLSFLGISREVSLQTLQTNALGSLWVSQEFLPLLGRGSRIIMISSGAGAYCQGVSSYAPMYSISKTTLNAITRHLHRDLQSQGIIVNAICPGWVRTDMGGSGASRSVSKGAETATWLASEASIKVNGKFLRDKKEIPW